ncbi:hypothetical protein HLH34_04525 [Gluconacetobacter azotocaptans]|uniref:Uncharacterized protein n=1 Tax=Gluconacetobacter azotocaptans TaxID=142834 RepID=A0A7W4JQU4_9PROT|nr:hypothetical protein [Gluconacetobacter azotocaptans]MBB2189229.1 hypothetical protein [Gluconacetobacter azotocaptans]GBQ32327.1 hypothetical protein AA13594_2338 [Gluconacetobacter azotocaptans DSM 13594]
MAHLSRRSLLRGAIALAGASALAACAVSTNGNVTTITLNVAKIDAYGQAGLNAAATVTGFLSTVPAAAPYVPLIAAAETALSGALTALSSAAGSALTIDYNDATWKTRVDSVLHALAAVGTAIGVALKGMGPALPASIAADANTAVSALRTVISLFEGLVGVSAARAVAAPEMTEAQALRVLGVSR